MRNWTPVLKESPKGLVYCSPSCGFDCLRADYEYAVAKAAEMANELGRGFIPTVHENCQWYYGIKKGFMEINPIVDNYTDRNVTDRKSVV